MQIDIVTFNTAERDAVVRFLDDLCAGGPWIRSDNHAVWPSREIPEHRLSLEDLNAQGNVTACAELITLFEPQGKEPDAVIFYGCAGVSDRTQLESVFIATQAHYCSLGQVRYFDSPDDPLNPRPGAPEKVEVKTKWIVDQDNKSGPLPAVTLGKRHEEPSFIARVQIPSAVVIAVDSVIEVLPAAGAPSTFPIKSSWSFADAMAHIEHTHGMNGSVIVDMESYGVGRAIAVKSSKGLAEKVIVLRVTTDDLVSKNDPNPPADKKSQEELLMDARMVLGDVIWALIEPTL